jgi:hypothetical protein
MVSINDIRRQVSLLSLIDPSVLIKSGPDRFRCLCMFHAENTPSMYVNRLGGVWRFRCFGCGAHGDVLDFVMLRDGIGLPAARELLSGGVVKMFSPPPPPPPWRVLECIGCGGKKQIGAPGDMAYLDVSGWTCDDDSVAACGRCNEG